MRFEVKRRLLMGTGLGLAAGLAHPAVLRAQPAPVILAAGSDPVYSPFFLAVQEGHFQAEGVTVSLQTYTDGGEGMNALVANQVHLAGAAEPTTLLRMARAELRPLAVWQQSGRNIKLVARKDIAGPERIRKFGIVAGTVSQYATGLAVAKFGLDPAAVQYVRSGPPELPALLVRGDVDAYFAWEPWPSIGLRQGGRVLTNSGAVGYTDTLWLNAQAGWLESNADAARGVLRGLARACASIRQNPQRAAAAVQAATRIPPAQSLALYGDVDFGVRDFTDADLESYDRIADFLAEQKVTPARVDFRRAVQRGFFKA